MYIYTIFNKFIFFKFNCNMIYPFFGLVYGLDACLRKLLLFCVLLFTSVQSSRTLQRIAENIGH